MARLALRFLRDDQGALIATEWVFVATILVIGLIVGLKAVQSAVLNELEEVAGAIGAVSQSYSFGGTRGCCGFTNGSSFSDDGPNTYPVTTCTEGQDGGGSSCPD
jgi:Flp pilus assembly pilin Flp